MESLESPRGIKRTLVIYVAAFFAKIAAFLVTGYLALLADALNSLTDIAMGIMMLGSFKLSRLPADESHPFGHGRGESAAALIAGVSFITVVSFGIVREAYGKLTSGGGEYGDPMLGIGVMVFAIVINFAGIAVLRSDLSKGESPASKALLVDLFNDQLSAVAAIVGIWGASHGYPLADPLAGIAIALLIAYTAFQLVKNNIIFLLGESPEEEFYRDVESAVMSVDDVEGTHDILAEYIGPNKIHVDLHIRVDPEMKVEEADPLTEVVSARVKEEVPKVVHAMVHVCPHGGGRRATVE